jgi:hypothetical protein
MSSKITVLSHFLVLVLSPSLLWAGTIVVPDDYTTIQDAVNNSNHNDTIVVKDGTYTNVGNRDIH